MNPNLKGVTAADLKETFELAMKIREKESAANEAVIRIRKLRVQLDVAMKGTTDQGSAAAAKELAKKMSAIEEELYQVKNRSGQDPLNFSIKLNNRLSALRRSLESGDNKPTAGVYQVFNELSKDLEVQLAKLSVIFTELPSLNQKLNLEIKK
jgi:hypothetical protein